MNMHKRARLRGFTLVELLVVIAIIGILVGLLLPAVQAAREAARRAQCQNNMRNIALACLNYHDVQGEFPMGIQVHQSQIDAGTTAEAGGTGVTPMANWAIMLLPFMEQQALQDSFVFSSSGNSGPIVPAGLAQLPEWYPCATESGRYCHEHRRIPLPHRQRSRDALYRNPWRAVGPWQLCN